MLEWICRLKMLNCSWSCLCCIVPFREKKETFNKLKSFSVYVQKILNCWNFRTFKSAFQCFKDHRGFNSESEAIRWGWGVVCAWYNDMQLWHYDYTIIGDYPMFCSWRTNNPPFFWIFLFFLILTPAWGSNPAGP